MKDITLQDLLEAGCHFGHKSERWHPKAQQFIYVEKDGIHIIDLAKTKQGAEEAYTFIKNLIASGSEILLVGTKRQAKGIVKDAAIRVGAPYITERWIGGFLTNWEGIHKNIQKINRLTEEQANGGWKKFPKHEQLKLARYLTRLKVFYGGVLKLNVPPQALFIVDVKKEIVAVKEAIRSKIPIIAMVDTNSDPKGISHVIPANDDAVGSISCIVNYITAAYEEGKATFDKMTEDAEKQKAVETAKKEAALAKVKSDDLKLAQKGDIVGEIKKEEQRLAEIANAKKEDSSQKVEENKKVVRKPKAKIAETK